MIRKSGSKVLPGLMLFLGIAAFMLRKALYGVAVDARGLLIRNSFPAIALTVLTGAALLVAVLAAWRQKDAVWGETGNLLGAVGNVAAGAGILVTVLTGAPLMGGYPADAWRLLGLAAPVCFGLAGIARMFGKKPFFLLHVVACLFFLVHIVLHYQQWSSNPQLQDYVFAMLGAMALMFFGFYTAAQEADCGNGPVKLGMGLTAVYLCLAELAGSTCPVLYLGGVLWVLAELIGMKSVFPDEEK